MPGGKKQETKWGRETGRKKGFHRKRRKARTALFQALMVLCNIGSLSLNGNRRFRRWGQGVGCGSHSGEPHQNSNRLYHSFFLSPCCGLEKKPQRNSTLLFQDVKRNFSKNWFFLKKDERKREKWTYNMRLRAGRGNDTGAVGIPHSFLLTKARVRV